MSDSLLHQRISITPRMLALMISYPFSSSFEAMPSSLFQNDLNRWYNLISDLQFLFDCSFPYCLLRYLPIVLPVISETTPS